MSSEEHHTPLLKPLPRRPFELSSSSNDSSAHSSPYIGSASFDDTHLEPPGASPSHADVSRTRSILNLTSSTLFGIYGPTAGTAGSTHDASQPPTPWGTGAETPSRERNGSLDDCRRPSLDLSRVRTNNAAEIERRLLLGDDQRGARRKTRSPVSPQTPHHVPGSRAHAVLQAVVRVTVLFVFGVAYGALVAHLQDDRHIAPVEVRGFNRAGWGYLMFWGLAGVGIGNLLPWVDSTWDGVNSTPLPEVDEREDRGPRKRGLAGVEWSDVVRGVGAFVGVAFAIRKLAWSSTLQLSLTLALANPFLWYLLDRTSTGFTLSMLIGVVGTVVLFFINPSVIPAPTSSGHYSNATAASGPRTDGSGFEGFPALDALLRSESVGVVTWIASVLFCSCVCFGNIGRLLVREQAKSR